jgi:hypothetical protein
MMPDILEKIRKATVGDRVSGTPGIVIGVGILIVVILVILGWWYACKFAWKSTDTGNSRCVSMGKTQKNLIKLYLVATFVMVVSVIMFKHQQASGSSW